MKKKILLVIPARMGSSRFPGKPLSKINNKTPMIEFIYNTVKKSKIIDQCYVATCDNQIADHMRSINGNFIMTSKKHKRATERCSEALKKLERKLKSKFDIITMLQGDEPLISLKMIEKGIMPLLKNNNLLVTNLISKINDKNEFLDKNCIKVVFNKKFDALMFSRNQIPSKKIFKNYGFKQVCSISFRRNFLIKYLKMKEGNLEKSESIDMLRILENGYNVRLVEVKGKIQSVDTKEDLIKVNRILKNF